MIEVVGNLWTYPADVRVITTNGFVKKNGECVMGRGCALEAAKRWSDLPRTLGGLITVFGNHVFLLPLQVGMLYSFPVKHSWWEKADLDLIKRSAEELAACVQDGFEGRLDGPRVVIPRPGCGNGQLKWEDVRPVLAPILDDRFHIITFGPEARP